MFVLLKKHKNMETFYRISSNKRERTITIRRIDGKKTTEKYRSYPLSNEDFFYYSQFATQNDIKNFLRGGDYYVC